jgi:ribosome-associated translation inhibitor RaiA
MQIQINTDPNIDGREAVSVHIHEVVTHALRQESGRITRVEIHLADENGPKTGPNVISCTMEARLERLQPLAVTVKAATVHQAVDAAADKLARLVEHTLGKLRDTRSERTDSMPPRGEPTEQS